MPMRPVEARSPQARWRTRRLAAHNTASAAAAASSRGVGGSRVMLAPGTVAATRATATKAPRTIAPAEPTTAPLTSGAPSETSHPAASAAAEAAMTGTTSGAAMRLASGDTSETRPKSSRMSGSVAACAASETPSVSTSQPGARSRAPGATTRSWSHEVRRVPHASSPAVAATESWNPASPITWGSTVNMATTARPSAAGAVPGRPSSRLPSTAAAIVAARTTLAPAPAASAYAAIAASVATERRRRLTRRRIAAMTPPTTAMFQPLIATMWVKPAAVNAVATSRSTWSRNPTRIPAARPACGAGRTRASSSPASRRRRSSHAAGPGGAGTRSRRRAMTVPLIPDRSRYSPKPGPAGGGRTTPSIETRSPGTTSG